MPSYVLSADGLSIHCLRCHGTSQSPADVEKHYCGFCHQFHDDVLQMFTIYESPSDAPGKWAVRRFLIIGVDSIPDALMGVATSLESARLLMPRFLFRLDRFPEDDPCIKEVWL